MEGQKNLQEDRNSSFKRGDFDGTRARKNQNKILRKKKRQEKLEQKRKPTKNNNARENQKFEHLLASFNPYDIINAQTMNECMTQVVKLKNILDFYDDSSDYQSFGVIDDCKNQLLCVEDQNDEYIPLVLYKLIMLLANDSNEFQPLIKEISWCLIGISACTDVKERVKWAKAMLECPKTGNNNNNLSFLQIVFIHLQGNPFWEIRDNLWVTLRNIAIAADEARDLIIENQDIPIFEFCVRSLQNLEEGSNAYWDNAQSLLGFLCASIEAGATLLPWNKIIFFWPVVNHILVHLIPNVQQSQLLEHQQDSLRYILGIIMSVCNVDNNDLVTAGKLFGKTFLLENILERLAANTLDQFNRSYCIRIVSDHTRLLSIEYKVSQRILQKGGLQILQEALLHSHRQATQASAALALSNMCTDSMEAIIEIVGNRVLRNVMQNFNNMSSRVRTNVLFMCVNMIETLFGRQDYNQSEREGVFQTIIQQHSVIRRMCETLYQESTNTQQIELCIAIMGALNTSLYWKEEYVKPMVEECDGDIALERLYNHDYSEISDVAEKILNKYWK